MAKRLKELEDALAAERRAKTGVESAARAQVAELEKEGEKFKTDQVELKNELIAKEKELDELSAELGRVKKHLSLSTDNNLTHGERKEYQKRQLERYREMAQ